MKGIMGQGPFDSQIYALDVANDVVKLMDDDETADFTLKSGSMSFKIHKAIFVARSTVFRAMFISNTDLEAVIEDVDGETLQELIHFIYMGRLSGKEFGIQPLCYAANKYQLEGLMKLIADEAENVELQDEEVAELFISAELFNQEKLYYIAMERLKAKKEIVASKEFQEKMRESPKILFKIITTLLS